MSCKENQNRPLSDQEVLKIVENDEFWEDIESERNVEPVVEYQSRKNFEDESIIEKDRLQACTDILVYGDESDKEEEDTELFSEHATDSEDDWVSSENELMSNGEDNIDEVLETEADNGDQNYGQDEAEDIQSKSQKEVRNNYWYGKNDKMKWSKNPPKRGKTLAPNLLRVLPSLKGEMRRNPPCNPLESWRYFFDSTMIEIIVKYTNQRIEKVSSKYGKLKRNKNSRRQYSPTFIKPTDITEIEAFIGLLYLQGVFKSAHEDLRSLWATDGTGRDLFRCTMSLARFSFLLCCIRFDDETTRVERRKVNKLAPISEIFEKFVYNSTQNYSPGENLTVDEMLVPFRGRCAFRMYMPNKPAKYGLKIQILTDCQTHYMLNAEVYTGKNITEQHKGEKKSGGHQKKLSHPTEVVLRLTEPIKNTGRNITGDNWYSSLELMKELENNNLTYVGTVKKNKRFIPSEFMPASNRKVNSSLFGFTKHETIVSFVPKKSKSVVLISSRHHDDKVDNVTKKPDIILFYNKTKVGVDSLDQKCANYSTSRRTRRWPMTLFHAILNIAGVNSRVVFQFAQEGKEIARSEFLKKLGRDLCIPYMQNRLGKTLPRSLKVVIESLLGNANLTSPAPQQRGLASKRKRCAICPSKNDRKTSTTCESCQIPICKQCAKTLCPTCI